MKINWTSEVALPGSQTLANIAGAKARNLPRPSKSDRPALAVIAGGPSVVEYSDEIKAFKGDVWGVGTAFPMAQSLRPEATFFSIDQRPEGVSDCAGAKSAILATCCDASLFDALSSVPVMAFDLVASGPDANHHDTSVTAIPRIALDMGYTDVTFYGCDSSFRDSTHAYDPHYQVQDEIVVICNGKAFCTEPGFLMQAEFMARVIRLFPNVFKLRGDGLLPDMVKDLDYDIVVVSNSIAERMKVAA